MCVFLRVHDTAATRGQYLALSKAWRSWCCCRWRRRCVARPELHSLRVVVDMSYKKRCSRSATSRKSTANAERFVRWKSKAHNKLTIRCCATCRKSVVWQVYNKSNECSLDAGFRTVSAPLIDRVLVLSPSLPYLTFGVGRFLHLPSAEAISVRPNAQPRCN